VKKTLGVVAAALLTTALAPLAAGALAANTRAAAPAALAKAAVDPHLASELASAKPTDRLVVFVHAADAGTAKHAVSASGLTLLDTFNKVGVAVGRGTPKAIDKAVAIPGVTYVEADRPISFFSDPEANAATREDEARSTIKDAGGNPYEGAGVSIAVVDSGIDGTHPMFTKDGKSKVVRNLKMACGYVNTCTGTKGDVNDSLFVDFTNTTNDTDTPSMGGHGTHVAGIAAGYDVDELNGRHLHGAAPSAKLVGISVGQALSVYAGDAGLNWVLEHHSAPCVDANGNAYSDPVTCPPIRVVNNSYGPTGGGEYDSSSTTVAIEQALVHEGVIVTWAAGNGDATGNGGDGSDVRTNPPGQDPTNGVIMVANYDDAGTGSRDNAVDASSSRGQAGRPSTYPDVAAPGTNITSACRPYLSVCSTGLDTTDPNYNTISGTSMATPYISGVSATLLSAKPTLTPGDVELALEDTAHKFVAGAPYEADLSTRNPDNTTSFDKGHGLVDVVGALDTVLGITAPLPPAGQAVCTATGPVAVDPSGDAKDFALAGALPFSEPALDVTRVDVTADPAHNTTFTVTVNSLGTANPQSSPNIAYDTYFTYAGQTFWVEASRATDGTLAYKVGQTIAAPALVTARLPLDTLTGLFDPAANTASVVLPADKLASLATKAPVDGDALTGMSTVSRRSATNEPSSQGESADTADASCPYTYGLGAMAGPPPPPPPGGDTFTPAPSQGTATTDQGYSWSSPVIASGRTDLVDTDCSSTEATNGCQRVGITVNVPAGGGSLTVNLTAQDLVDDYDFAVYAPDGAKVGEGATLGGVETMTGNVTATGVYTVVVTGFSQNVTGYDADASLSATTAAPPPDIPSEGTASPGSPYTWHGTTPLPSNVALACLPEDPVGTGHGPGTVVCDMHNVKVDVPSGGGHLTVTATPDVSGDVFTIYVYDAAGNEIHSGTTRSGDGTWTVPVTRSGVYRIGITSSLDTGGYTGTASIA
jgi:serine protease AprX